MVFVRACCGRIVGGKPVDLERRENRVKKEIVLEALVMMDQLRLVEQFIERYAVYIELMYRKCVMLMFFV